jgi:hypothetical protein
MTSSSFAPDWILDSGATHHITTDLNNLSSFYAYNDFDTLQAGNGHGLPIQRISYYSLYQRLTLLSYMICYMYLISLKSH